MMTEDIAAFRVARKQEGADLSRSEAEYIKLCTCIKEITWIGRLAQSIPVFLSRQNPKTIHVNIQSFIRIAASSSLNRRTKHKNVQYRYTRNSSVKNFACWIYCSGDKMIADMLIKMLRRVSLR